MQYGICHFNVISVRLNADHTSEMITQLLYGEHFKILESRKFWSKIRVAFDKCEGWIPNNQLFTLEKPDYDAIDNSKNLKCVADLISFISLKKGTLLPVILGSSLQATHLLEHKFEGNYLENNQEKSHLIETALLYLNAPYLWGGRTLFGLDASALTQLTYKVNGYQLKRTALEQSTQGQALSFIEESEPGDLAFFDDNDGIINHVGIVMKNNYIIHCHGNVRIDRLDHTGIFNTDSNRYTHKLRVLKKII